MYLKLKVVANSRKENVEQIKPDGYRVHVKEPAENNRANERVLEVIRGMYPHARVRLVSGHTSPSKIVSVDQV